MIDVIKFKRRIIKIALQGKLTKQNPSTESVDSLLTFLFKKNKKYATFSDDLIDYDIPKSWKWCMTYEAVSLENGDEINGEKLPYLDVKYLRTGKNPTILDNGKVVYPGSKVILVDGENSGEVFAVNEKGFKGSTFKIMNVSKAFLSEYILYFITLYKEKFRGNKTGSAIPHLNKTIFFELPIPLPPLEEQERIVKTLDSIFSLLDIVSDNQDKLFALKESFKDKIVELAIKGKIVKQSEEDGDSEQLYSMIVRERQKWIANKIIRNEKPFEPIHNDEMTFEIPTSWKWIRLGELGSYKKGPFGSALTKSMFVPKSNNSIKVYEQKNAIQKDWRLGNYFITRKYYNDQMSSFTVLAGDIIVSCAGTIGETYVIPECAEIGIINQALMRIRLSSFIDVEYFLMYFDRILKSAANNEGKGTAIKNIPPFEILKSMIVAVPPLNEQKRIVAKTKELLSICEKII